MAADDRIGALGVAIVGDDEAVVERAVLALDREVALVAAHGVLKDLAGHREELLVEVPTPTVGHSTRLTTSANVFSGTTAETPAARHGRDSLAQNCARRLWSAMTSPRSIATAYSRRREPRWRPAQEAGDHR